MCLIELIFVSLVSNLLVPLDSNPCYIKDCDYFELVVEKREKLGFSFFLCE